MSPNKSILSYTILLVLVAVSFETDAIKLKRGAPYEITECIVMQDEYGNKMNTTLR